jgi:hypothetical protein
VHAFIMTWTKQHQKNFEIYGIFSLWFSDKRFTRIYILHLTLHRKRFRAETLLIYNPSTDALFKMEYLQEVLKMNA